MKIDNEIKELIFNGETNLLFIPSKDEENIKDKSVIQINKKLFKFEWVTESRFQLSICFSCDKPTYRVCDCIVPEIQFRYIERDMDIFREHGVRIYRLEEIIPIKLEAKHEISKNKIL